MTGTFMLWAESALPHPGSQRDYVGIHTQGWTGTKNRPGHFGPHRPNTFNNAHLFSLFGLLNVYTNSCNSLKPHTLSHAMSLRESVTVDTLNISKKCTSGETTLQRAFEQKWAKPPRPPTHTHTHTAHLAFSAPFLFYLLQNTSLNSLHPQCTDTSFSLNPFISLNMYSISQLSR